MYEDSQVAHNVVFSYAGDLWLASSSGGTATRLTADPGLELFAKFSPDGQWIAFTGQYDGDEQVYVMPTAGGVPEQLTYYPARGSRSTVSRRRQGPARSPSGPSPASGTWSISTG